VSSSVNPVSLLGSLIFLANGFSWIERYGLSIGTWRKTTPAFAQVAVQTCRLPSTSYFASPDVATVPLLLVEMHPLELLLDPLPVSDFLGSSSAGDFGVLARVALKDLRTDEKGGAGDGSALASLMIRRCDWMPSRSHCRKYSPAESSWEMPVCAEFPSGTESSASGAAGRGALAADAMGCTAVESMLAGIWSINDRRVPTAFGTSATFGGASAAAKTGRSIIDGVGFAPPSAASEAAVALGSTRIVPANGAGFSFTSQINEGARRKKVNVCVHPVSLVTVARQIAFPSGVAWAMPCSWSTSNTAVLWSGTPPIPWDSR
jgi:hypothetical protein